ncbi:hypothetical protein CJ030_MR7G001008 [Morella rubra]|uniref:Uncharacterized protein n=1 Tax=Morella rubra TaxID=262757 RepID=A0A6A1V828_9ROSI|nr:hypothetical protein CJ030_MR7G001008 [Morella rubra]
MSGNDDLKSQDGKESDEVSSPVSGDQDRDQSPFNEGSEELGVRDPLSIQSFAAKDNSKEAVPGDVEYAEKIGEDDSLVKIERELKPAENSGSKNGSIEHSDSSKESHDGDNRGSSGSSSDDEFLVTEKKPEKDAYNSILEISSYDDLVKPVDPQRAEVMPAIGNESLVTEKKPEENAYDSVLEESSYDDLAKPVDPQRAEVMPAIGNESLVTEKKPEEDAYNSVLEVSSYDDLAKPVDPQRTEVMPAIGNAPGGETVDSIADTTPDVVYSIAGSTPVVDSVKPVVSPGKKPEEQAYNSVLEASSYDDLIKPVDPPLAEVMPATGNAPGGEAVISTAESVPDADSVRPVFSVSQETIHMTAPVENAVTADVVESGPKESEEKLVPKSGESPAAETDSALKNNEDKVFLLPDENVLASSTVVEPVSSVYEVKTSPSSSVPVAATTCGAGHVKVSETPDCSESQPVVAPAPQVVQKTSWLSCCGLFELLTGFGR